MLTAVTTREGVRHALRWSVPSDGTECDVPSVRSDESRLIALPDMFQRCRRAITPPAKLATVGTSLKLATVCTSLKQNHTHATESGVSQRVDQGSQWQRPSDLWP